MNNALIGPVGEGGKELQKERRVRDEEGEGREGDIAPVAHTRTPSQKERVIDTDVVAAAAADEKGG